MIVPVVIPEDKKEKSDTEEVPEESEEPEVELEEEEEDESFYGKSKVICKFRNLFHILFRQSSLLL